MNSRTCSPFCTVLGCMPPTTSASGRSARWRWLARLGRQSHSQWRPHAANSSQCSPHLLATEQRRLCRVGEVTALRSSHPAGNRSDRTLTLSWLAKSSALPRSFRPLSSPTTSNRSSATLRAYPDVCPITWETFSEYPADRIELLKRISPPTPDVSYPVDLFARKPA